ncbi:hypothetical protein WHR41_08865 [Cladosporium halotolerans]|uniref:DhaL domain-containing protein n=1 Tax=Cladosporium halotolerans TaxID=1052096 RepID=A0AB34KC41_9PEZI
MAVVVEQTIPFPPEALDLQNAQRWNDLYPLIRPSVKQVQTAKGQHILVDEALVKSKYVNIAAIGNLSNFSSKLLDDKSVTAIVTEKAGAGVFTTQDITHALASVGALEKQGLVVVRSGKNRNVQVHGSDVIEVEAAGELESDHLIHLLGHATESCRSSLHQTTDLVNAFVKSASTAFVTFQTEKAGGKPAISGSDGVASGYDDVKSAIEKELGKMLKGQTVQGGQVTYSIHYSDINGLSRLENYILAKEIADLCHSQNIPFRLSHSTILNHREAARGFALSICPIPTHNLSPQPKPQPDTTSTTSNGTPLSKTLSPSTAQMAFDDAQVRARIHAGCAAVIKEEPTITEYDTIVGDGDCGYTLRDGAKQVLSFIEGKDLARLPETVAALVHDLEVNMGGTSGALYCIFLTALAASLASEPSVPKALKGALEQLLKYTRARLGDRTMMDALIPFVETLEATGDVDLAVRKASEGVDGTKKMEAKLGRSTYLDESATQGVPDPGAYGLLVLLQGMAKA